ncbi:unnamed protein product [Rotaria magnacalcarata]|uniref:Uncharacterized protein n=2 Tax=Rotaria magnacalcarata TaxID=392030 RepID=A0A815RYL3_9BILA|nr:unnamed protein product [Rotaria magnacalcarata]CAF4289850.1 unnamed protein product [Rotaria magnacalcarata]
MFPTEALIDTSILPSDIMLLRDVKFFDFVRKEAGDAAVDLFEIQSINCVKSLLMTVDVYCIMNLKSKALYCFKSKHGFMLDDDTFIIKPGIKGNVDYLIDLLKQKCTDDAKLTKSLKRNQSSSPLDRTINRSSTTTESTMAVLSSNSSNVVTSKSLNLSLDEHKTYVNNTLNNWCKNNELRLNLSNVSLIEGQHYSISILNDASGVLKANIKFCCNKWIPLTNNRGKFQLSNFYRHLQDFRNNNTCDKMKELIKNCKLISSIAADNQQSFTCSDTVSDQESSSDTTPDHESSSNAVLLNSTSTSITTDDHESLERPSPLLKSKSRAKRKFHSVESSYNTKEVVKRTRRQ